MHFLRLTLFFGATQALLVPSPPGPYSVAVKHFELIDQNRTDPLAPEPDTKRRFMASAYLPIAAGHHCDSEVVTYLPPRTATVFGQVGAELGLPKGMLDNFEMEFCNMSTVKTDNYERRAFPIAVFSPGLGGSRLLYGALAKSLASLGHIVITVDHTHETYVVEFPDGSVANSTLDLGTISGDNSTALLDLLKIRTGDVSFLASQLSNTTLMSRVLGNFPGTYNSQRVAVFGHSLGGATAAISTQEDSSVIGGLNFDGTVFGPVGEQGFKGKPFVLVASARSANNTVPPLPGWDEFYQNVDAAKMLLAVRDTQHYSFMDIPILLMDYPLPVSSKPVVEQVIGTLDARRLEKAQNEIMSGLLDLLFKNQTKPLEHLARSSDILVVQDDFTDCS